MNPPIIKEYYMVDGTPVVMVMTDARIGMQSWAADRYSREMKRDYGLMVDIARGHHDGQISEPDFVAYCKTHSINSVIPPKGLLTSFRLAQQGQGVIKNVPLTDRLYRGLMGYAPL